MRVRVSSERGARAIAAMLACGLLVPMSASADYSPPSLPTLVLASEAIVYGEIVALSAETFELRVDEHVAGPVPVGRRMTVHRFQDWMCAQRWVPYATGQRAVYFLRLHEGAWHVQSAGGEGEMPVAGDRVHVSGAYSALAPSGTNPYDRLTVHGGTYSGFTLARSDLLAAVRAARACHRATLTNDTYRRIASVRMTCAEADARAARSTPLGAALFAAMRL
jgi:hypothetical protein